MTVQRMSIAPEYVSFYAAGRRNVRIPTHMDRRGVLSSEDCILIPAYYWSDGDTYVTFGPAAEITEAGNPDFDGILNTPNSMRTILNLRLPMCHLQKPISVFGWTTRSNRKMLLSPGAR
jgi:hypothetical protein